MLAFILITVQCMEFTKLPTCEHLNPPVMVRNSTALDYLNLKDFVEKECATYSKSILRKEKGDFSILSLF